MSFGSIFMLVCCNFGLNIPYKLSTLNSYIQQLREGVHNFFATFIEVLRDRPPGHDWELEPGVTCGDYLFGMLQV